MSSEEKSYGRIDGTSWVSGGFAHQVIILEYRENIMGQWRLFTSVIIWEYRGTPWVSGGFAHQVII